MTQARAFARRQPEGLYDPSFDHDACGVAFVANLTAEPSHQIVAKGLEALRNLDHRGATGSDPKTGDGAGMLLQIPDAFLRAEWTSSCPGRARTRSGTLFCPPIRTWPPRRRSPSSRSPRKSTSACWAGVGCAPTTPRCRDVTRSNMPYFEQLFVTAKDAPLMGIALDRLAYCLRRRTQHETGVYFASLSARTIVYKGMLTTEQLPLVFPELLDERMASALVVVHSRFSTNTFPAWELAHPFRMIAHNGEINTVMGNRNWMRAREALLRQRRDPRRPGAAVPDLHAGRLGLGLVRRGGRAAAPRRPFAAARAADDDPGGVGEQPRHGPQAARLLRLPLLPDGAVGRAGEHHLHRRHPGRCGAGPQRSAARPLLGDR